MVGKLLFYKVYFEIPTMAKFSGVPSPLMGCFRSDISCPLYSDRVRCCHFCQRIKVQKGRVTAVWKCKINPCRTISDFVKDPWHPIPGHLFVLSFTLKSRSKVFKKPSYSGGTALISAFEKQRQGGSL